MNIDEANSENKNWKCAHDPTGSLTMQNSLELYIALIVNVSANILQYFLN